MEKKVFMELGQVIRGCILVQTGPGVGMLIHLNTGNRINDSTVELISKWQEAEHSYDRHVYGATIEDLREAYPSEVFGQEWAPKPPKKKPGQIQLTRFVRPLDRLGQIDNLFGLTLYVVLDYDERTVSYSYSFCNGENFEKGVGQRIAKARFDSKSYYCRFSMPEGGIPKDGVVDLIKEHCIKQIEDGDTNKEPLTILGAIYSSYGYPGFETR